MRTRRDSLERVRTTTTGSRKRRWQDETGVWRLVYVSKSWSIFESSSLGRKTFHIIVGYVPDQARNQIPHRYSIAIYIHIAIELSIKRPMDMQLNSGIDKQAIAAYRYTKLIAFTSSHVQSLFPICDLAVKSSIQPRRADTASFACPPAAVIVSAISYSGMIAVFAA